MQADVSTEGPAPEPGGARRIELMARKWGWLVVGASAVACFHASLLPGWWWLSVPFLAGIWWLATHPALRMARPFYFGLALGLCLYAPQLTFFWGIFGPGAAALWVVLASWLGIFFVFSCGCVARWGSKVAALLVPALWTGVEYFRCELYYLRFTWLTTGYTLSGLDGAHLFLRGGVYGYALVVLLTFSTLWLGWKRSRYVLVTAGVALGLVISVPRTPADHGPSRKLHVTGVQLEFPGESEVLLTLRQLAARFPQTELVVLSEYAFDGPVPKAVKAWCRQTHRYLVAGGKDFLGNGQFNNTVFVVDPSGEIVFKQVKAVPIQFFKDGRPAREQRVWKSPWGPLGFCICYDLGYSRITDELVRQGAAALIVPTMDIEDWGRRQHELHARIAPLRAAEYGIPIFRLASSGISQWVGPTGRVLASAPFPGPGVFLPAELEMSGPAHLPPDRLPAMLCAVMAGGLGLVLLWQAAREGRIRFRASY